MSLSIAVMSAGITRRLVDRFGSRTVLVPATMAAVGGLLILATAGAHPVFALDVLPGLLLIGLGAGASFIPLLTMAMADVPGQDAGLGSGIVNVSMQMTSAVGLAVLSTVAAERTKSLLGEGSATTAALVGGYRLAFLVAAAFVGVGTLLVLVLLHDAEDEAEDAPGDPSFGAVH